jgi:serine/threonine-protein kinase
MERIHGTTLRNRLARDGAFSSSVAADWFDGLLSGLGAAHDAGIVHRDLKPENVIARETNSHISNVKILDFGLAKFRVSDATSTTRLTAGGFVRGTPGYMSPEYLLGHDVDHRSDIFSVGVMLVEVLSGKRPFDESGHLVNYDLPPALKRIAQNCLAGNPEDRPRSAIELRRDLIEALRAR